MRTYVIAFAFSLAFSCLGQDGKRERVKVELSTPVSYNASVSEVKPAKPDAFEVKDVEPAKEADPIKSSEVPALLAVALDTATEAQVPYIAATMYADLVKATVKNCSPVELAVQTEWYERFQAVGGSKMWWILRVAKMRAERGEDVSSLKKAFDETMNKWLLED